jgi:hypothetical protein
MTINTLSHILAGAALAAFVLFGAATAHAAPARAGASSTVDAASAMPQRLKTSRPQ